MIRARFYLGTQATTPERATSWRDLPVRVARVADILAELNVPGATVLPAVGLWQGTRDGTTGVEPSLVVELLGDYTEESVRSIATELREAHDQDTVLWTLEPIHSGSANRTDPKGD